MKNLCRDNSWLNQGISFIWSAQALESASNPSSVVTIRQCFATAQHWPEELPSNHGNALVVAGVEGCLDTLDEEDAMAWLEHDLKQVILKFQSHYEGQAALIFWLPSGHSRICMERATEEYFWKRTAKPAGKLPFGRALFAGAESDILRIILSNEPAPDFDGNAWVGLHLPRIS